MKESYLPLLARYRKSFGAGRMEKSTCSI